MNRAFFLVHAVAVSAFCGAALSHHSTAEYDRNATVEFVGELTDVYWGNPHPHYRMRITTEGGDDAFIELEGSAVYVLERNGVRQDMITVGQRVRVAGYRSTRRNNWIQLSNMLLEDGYEVRERGAEALWTNPDAGQTGGGAESDRQTGLFQVWSRASLGDGLDFGELPLTLEAAQRQSEWDPIADNPALQCIEHGMPAIMPNPFPLAFVDHDGWIEMNLSNTVIREIHLTELTDGAEPTSQGYSVGRWDGATLTIHTNAIDWPFFDDNGTPQSDRVEIDERFVLSDGGARLDYEITVTDGETFTRPVSASVTYAALGESLADYQYCPENSAD